MSALDFLKKAKNIRLLPPKDKEFYKLFGEISETLVRSGELLIELFDSQIQNRAVISTKIETCLTRCAQISDSIEQLLTSSQQPPFDRAAISQFGDDSFRIMKYINHAANRYVVYEFPTSDKEMRELAPLVLEACDEILKAVKGLKKDRNIEPYCRAVDLLETKADEVYHEGLRRRFQEIRKDRVNLEKRILEAPADITAGELLPIISANVEYTRHVAVFFILRQVYEELERAIDACTEAAADLKRMVAENV